MNVFKRLPEYLKIIILSYRPTHPTAKLVEGLIPAHEFYKSIVNIGLYERIIANFMRMTNFKMKERISMCADCKDAINEATNFNYYHHKNFKIINRIHASVYK